MRIDLIPKAAGVYRITHLRSGRVYIGSSIDMRQRASVHLSSLSYGEHANEYLQRTWNAYGSGDFIFEVVELVGDAQHLRGREQEHMDASDACNRAKGFNLTPNARALQHTEETRRKIGEKAKGRKPSAETRARISEAARNRSAEVVARLTAPLRNKSPEHLAKMGAAHRGKVISAEQRAKQSATTKGRKQTPEHIEARAAARRGKQLSESHKATLSRLAIERRFLKTIEALL